MNFILSATTKLGVQPFAKVKVLNHIRTLFSPNTLGINSYEEMRGIASLKVNTSIFKKDFEQELQPWLPLPKLVNNLKMYVHVFDNSSQDIDLLKKGLIMYRKKHLEWKKNVLLNKRTEEDKENEFQFGTVVMRAFHMFDLPDYAIEFFDDPKLRGIFNQLFTFSPFLDLLYNNKRYGHVLKIYDYIKLHILPEGSYVQNEVNSIVFATYYQLNTPYHFELAKKLYDDLVACGRHNKQFRETITLVAAMRLKQNKPQECLQILSSIDNFRIEIKCVKILAFSQLGNFAEVFKLLRTPPVLIKSSSWEQVPREVLLKIEHRLKEIGKQNEIKEFQIIQREMERLNWTSDKHFDDMLCATFPANIYEYNKNKIKNIRKLKSV